MSNSDQPPPYEEQPGYSGRTAAPLVAPPLFIHECVSGCPALPPKPGQPGYVPPQSAGPIQVAPPPGKNFNQYSQTVTLCKRWIRLKI